MAVEQVMRAEGSVPLLLEGYGWLPNRRRRTEGEVVRTRLLGRPTFALCGPDAARFFYDEQHVRRHGAVPELAQGTVFGHDAVHTLDGAAHRHRKAIFGSLLTAERFAPLVQHVAQAWDEAAAGWVGRPVVLFDEAARVLTRSVLRWSGVPFHEDEVDGWAADLVAMVDGFGTLGPRHWRARWARFRRERTLAHLVHRVRTGDLFAPAGSALRVVAEHHQRDGTPLPTRLAAVELLNVVRPTAAVCWFVSFAGHALHRWPRHRVALATGDPAFAEAFAHELRRFYPFAPVVGGRAVQDLTWRGTAIPAGSLVLLDLYGQNHDPQLWPDPYTFDPQRFVARPPGVFDLVPQGGGDPATGHRCPGEDLTVALLRTIGPRLAAQDHELPEQDLTISLRRVPARVASGVVLVARSTPARSGAQTRQGGGAGRPTGA